VVVATERQPERDPIQEEGERILRENPELLARMKEYQRKRQAGEPLKLVEHEEVRRQLKELGVPSMRIEAPLDRGGQPGPHRAR
jgi:hypothetical protein